MDFSEKWGKSIDIAVNLALQDLKLERDDVEVIVLEEPSNGFFGIGSKLAKVRVVKKAPEEKAPMPPKPKENRPKERVKQETVQKNKAEKNNRERPKKERTEKAERVEKIERAEKPEKAKLVTRKPEDLVKVDEHAAIDFLEKVTKEMGLNLEITAEKNEDCIYINIKGKDSGTIIGKRGQTLDAIQYLTSLVVNKEDGKHTRVIVDAENYRAKREKTLEQLAERIANKVIRTKRSVKLEPMNPYERKVIHASLQGNPSVVTRSEGEEPYRRVIIELK